MSYQIWQTSIFLSQGHVFSRVDTWEGKEAGCSWSCSRHYLSGVYAECNHFDRNGPISEQNNLGTTARRSAWESKDSKGLGWLEAA